MEFARLFTLLTLPGNPYKDPPLSHTLEPHGISVLGNAPVNLGEIHAALFSAMLAHDVHIGMW